MSEFQYEGEEVPDEIGQFLEDGHWWIAPGRCNTRNACCEVLSRLPGDLRDAILYKNDLIIIAPEKDILGRALPMNIVGELSPPARITFRRGAETESIEAPQLTQCHIGLVYLAPELDLQPHAVIIAVVAHEIAHCVTRSIFGEESEALADRTIEEWGFQEELIALRQHNPNHRY